MNSNLEAALVAAAVSLAVAGLSFVGTLSTIRAARERLREEQRLRFTDKLYTLRLACYQEAFEITQHIGKRATRSDEEIANHVKEVQLRLGEWFNKRAAMLLSDSALRAFYALKNALSRNPAKYGVYQRGQLDKMWSARNELRRQLRADLGLLFETDDRDA